MHSENTSRNSGDFIEQVSGLPIDDNEIMVSFDVSALYTSLPIDRVLEVVRNKLESDDTGFIGAICSCCTRNRNFTRVLLTIYVFHLSRKVLPSYRWCGDGFSSVLSCSQRLHGGTRTESTEWRQAIWFSAKDVETIRK